MRRTVVVPDPADLETVPCDFCGEGFGEPWARARGNTLTRCPRCGLIWTNPRVQDREVKDRLFYPREYFAQEDRFTPDQIAARARVHAAERARIESFVPRGRILDVGCGMGTFLEGFGPHWEKHGCDLSSYGLDEAARRGVRTYHGEFELLDLGGARFEVVTMRASLHHTYAPDACFRAARERLEEGGILAILMSNNASGIMGRLFRGHIRSYDQTIHYLFTEPVLIAYLERNGFTVIAREYPYFGTGYGSFLDVLSLPALYAAYRFACACGVENSPRWRDFSSPPFRGNYINLFARKAGS